MAITLVNHVAIPGGTSGGTSAGVNTGGADLLVVTASQFLTTPPAISDSLSNTWLPLWSFYDSGANLGSVAFYCLTPTTGGGHTFTLAGGFSSSEVQAFVGVGSLGSTSGATAGSGTSFQPGSLTPGVDGALLISGATFSGEPTTSSVAVDSGFTVTDQQPFNSGQYFGTAMAYLIQATAAAVNPTFSWTGSASEVNAGMVIFNPAAAPPSGNPTGIMLMGVSS